MCCCGCSRKLLCLTCCPCNCTNSSRIGDFGLLQIICPFCYLVQIAEILLHELHVNVRGLVTHRNNTSNSMHHVWPSESDLIQPKVYMACDHPNPTCPTILQRAVTSVRRKSFQQFVFEMFEFIFLCEVYPSVDQPSIGQVRQLRDNICTLGCIMQRSGREIASA